MIFRIFLVSFSFLSFSLFSKEKSLPPTIYGYVKALHDVQLSFKAPGMIQELKVDVGSKVEAGQKLASLFNQQQRLQIEMQRAQIQQLQKQLNDKTESSNQEKELFEKEVTSEDAVKRLKLAEELARLNVVQSQLQLKIFKNNLSDTFLTAPFKGEIVAKNFQVGSYVNPGQSVVHLVDASQVEVEFDVAEHLRQVFPKGTILKGSWDGKKTVKLKVSYVAPFVLSNHTYKMKAQFKESAKDYVPGMQMKAEKEM